MPFIEYRVQRKAMGGGTGLSVSLRKTKAGHASLHVFFSAAIATDLGWTPGDKLDVLLGTEDQHGLFRLRKNGSGSAEIKARNVRGGTYLAVSLGHIDTFVDRREEKRFCTFEKVEESWVEVVLPRWADETRPGGQRVAAAPPHLEQRRPTPLPRPPLGQRATQPPRRVLSMGDPGPGRSALATRGADLAAQATRRAAEEDGRRQSEAISRDERRASRETSAVPAAASLSITQKKVLSTLIDGVGHSLQEIAQSVGTISKSSVPPQISVLRQKLRVAGITIETISGGFQMKPEMADQARAYL